MCSRSRINLSFIRESVDSLCRDGADTQYMQYETCHLSCHYHLPSNDMPTFMAECTYIAFVSNE